MSAGSRAKTILLGTTNPAKGARLRWLLEGTGYTPRPLSDLPQAPPPDEEGDTFRDNAARKARHWSRLAGGLALSSDGGALISALGDAWRPLLTRRWAGAHANDVQRVRSFLKLVRHLRGEERCIHWTEALALAHGGVLLATWEAQSQPSYLLSDILPEQIVPGLWLGSLCYYPHLGKRYPELSPQELAAVDDHWSQLRTQVHSFLQRLAG